MRSWPSVTCVTRAHARMGVSVAQDQASSTSAAVLLASMDQNASTALMLVMVIPATTVEPARSLRQDDMREFMAVV